MRKGQKMPEEMKKKRSLLFRNINNPIWKLKGDKHPMWGKKHSEETKLKISKSNTGHISHNKGKHLSEETRKRISDSKKGKPSWNKGIKQTEEHKKRNSEARRGDKHHLWGKNIPIETRIKMSQSARRGEKHHKWRGGITEENHKIRSSFEYKLWRTAVFERDNYTCIWCKTKSKKGKRIILNADHIKSFAFFPELRFAIDNGRTLCIDCHKKTFTYGKKLL